MKKRLTAVLALLLACCAPAIAQGNVQDAAAKAAEALSQTEEAQAAPVKPSYWAKSVKFDLVDEGGVVAIFSKFR